MFVRHFDEAAVADGDAVGVTREIGQHLFWSGERALGVHHPFTVSEWRQMGEESGPIDKPREIVEEA
jgi:hypothetical protein